MTLPQLAVTIDGYLKVRLGEPGVPGIRSNVTLWVLLHGPQPPALQPRTRQPEVPLTLPLSALLVALLLWIVLQPPPLICSCKV